MAIHTFNAKRFYAGYDTVAGRIPDRDVTFTIIVDTDKLLSDKGGRALGKSRKTQVANGGVTITAVIA